MGIAEGGISRRGHVANRFIRNGIAVFTFPDKPPEIPLDDAPREIIAFELVFLFHVALRWIE